MTWHALLAPLPPEAMPVVGPVGSPEILATPEGASIAGWTKLVVHLSVPCDGSRTLLVMLDGHQTLLSASDGVLYAREEAEGSIWFRHESVGGRFEPDGRFAGRHWLAENREMPDDTVVALMPPVGREPTPHEVASLRALVDEVVRRSLL